MAQVDIEHYDMENYLGPGHWNSYYYQITETVRRIRPDGTVLVIGKGDGIVPFVLKNYYGIKVFTFDFDENLNPDYMGDVRKITEVINNTQFDIVICCEVLEHIPYEDFRAAINEIKKVTKCYLILSLPDGYKKFRLLIEIGKKRKNIIVKRKGGKLEFNGEHYWELGRNGVTDQCVKEELKSYFKIEKTWVDYRMIFHRFFY